MNNWSFKTGAGSVAVRLGSIPAVSLIVAGSLIVGGPAAADPIPVQLEQTDDGWRLLRGGEPYFIRGAGGDFSMEELAAAGANSVRLWDAESDSGVDVAGPLLDEAHALGLTVALGIWLEHERHGFDYDDPGQVRHQFERARRIVKRYKDHPALLLWGVGNETEGFDEGDNPAVWKAINDIAEMIKQLDPNHPTMAVTAFVHGERIEFLHRQSPAIDIHGVNAYGPAAVVHEHLRDGGASKPFVLTEFGPPGPWETGSTGWGAPFEPTSTAKAAFYRKSYLDGIEAQRDLALGSYVFLWGHKMEATPTWFGMWLSDGARLAAVDVMTELWTGQRPANQAPNVEPLHSASGAEFDPGAEFDVRAVATDPENGPLRASWALRPESGDNLTGGDFRPDLPEIEGAVLCGTVGGARIRLPDQPGAYRVYYTVYDDTGNAATANLPVLSRGDR